jgi:hypothetical protein
LVVENLITDIRAGIPFMESNDVSVHPARRQVSLGSDIVYTYASETAASASNQHSVRRAHRLRAPAQVTTLWPGDFVEVRLPSEYCSLTCEVDICVIPHDVGGVAQFIIT